MLLKDLFETSDIAFENTTHSNGTIAVMELSPESAARIANWCKRNGISCMDTKKLHCTVLFSRKPVMSLIGLNGRKISVHARIKGLKKLGPALAFVLDCPEAANMHKMMINQGGTHDYPDYTPHVSLTYDWPSADLPDVEIPQDMVLEFDTLLVDEIDPNYAEKTIK